VTRKHPTSTTSVEGKMPFRMTAEMRRVQSQIRQPAPAYTCLHGDEHGHSGSSLRSQRSECWQMDTGTALCGYKRPSIHLGWLDVHCCSLLD
jgi:hypothetical protein